MKENQAKYLRPENCEKLIVPSINKVIKDMMGTCTLAREKPLQFTQLAITKASCALSEVVNDLLSSTALDTRALVTTITDVLALLGHAHVTLSHKRRDVLSPDLKKCYSGLTSPDVPITTNLFGDDILKTMADLKKTNSAQYKAKYSQPKNYRAPRKEQSVQRETATTEVQALQKTAEATVAHNTPDTSEVNTHKVSKNNYATFVCNTISNNSFK